MSGFPVFGIDGKQEGDLMDGTAKSGVSLSSLPSGSFQAQRGTVLRDCNAIAERDAKDLDRAWMAAKPELAKAIKQQERAVVTAQEWRQRVEVDTATVLRLQALAQRNSVTYEDAEAGTRQERLKAAEARLAESREELGAALEELATAQERVTRANL